MRRLALGMLRHPGAILSCALIAVLGFALLLAITGPGGCSATSSGRAISATLTLLLAIDSPTNLLQSRSAVVTVFGWIISLMGWLILPLFVGIVVDVSLGRAQSYLKLRMLFREMGAASHIEGADLERFANEMMKKIDTLLSAKGD